ncbi:hypothetical protein P4C99_21435 [Pontiellaceae bacterium B1224]|nr:hypothetical protein [Pontiellaceae bacterium B1224]
MKIEQSRKIILPGWVKAVLICTVIGVNIINALHRSQEASIRAEVISFLNTTNANTVVKVDGIIATNSEIIISELKEISKARGNHSHPLEPFGIIIENGTNTLKLVMARDSKDPVVYWIHAPDLSPYYYESIGGIRTDIFNNRK